MLKKYHSKVFFEREVQPLMLNEKQVYEQLLELNVERLILFTR
jgi:hypothetical protein